jgi:peptidoglycan L-alanyl-D-glutamate endopeptidase CwlK
VVDLVSTRATTQEGILSDEQIQTGYPLAQLAEGVHPDMVRVVCRAIEITDIDFTVLEGVRSLDRQRQLLKAGASKTLKSRHLTGHAVDLGALFEGEVSWSWPLYHRIAFAVKSAAIELGVKIDWGGDWTTFKDGPHFQLSWREYPAHAEAEAKS